MANLWAKHKKDKGLFVSFSFFFLITKNELMLLVQQDIFFIIKNYDILLKMMVLFTHFILLSTLSLKLKFFIRKNLAQNDKRRSL